MLTFKHEVGKNQTKHWVYVRTHKNQILSPIVIKDIL